MNYNLKDKQLLFKAEFNQIGEYIPGIVEGEIRFNDNGIYIGIAQDYGVQTALSSEKVLQVIDEELLNSSPLCLSAIIDSTGKIVKIINFIPDEYLGRNISETFDIFRKGWMIKVTGKAEGTQWQPDGRELKSDALVICIDKAESGTSPKWTVIQSSDNNLYWK